MPNNTVDFRLRLIDDLSKEMKKTQKITESSLKGMSKEQVKLTKKTHDYEKQIVDLRNEQHKASKDRKKQIREEIRLLGQLNKQTKKQLVEAGKQQRVKTKTTFGDRISGGVTAGIGRAAGMFGGAAAVGGLAMSAYDMSKEVAKVETSLKRAFQSTGEELTKQESQVRFLSQAYDEDYKQVVQSANALSKEMGISGTEALKLIEQGFQKGANESGEFLDMLKEYPTQLKEVGLNAEESIALMTQQVQEGIYSDKGVDAIKEAGLRLKANNKATKTALGYLKKQTQDEIKLQIAKGDTFKAIQLISKGLKDTSLSAEQTQALISDVFGGPGEDAGLRYLKTLGDINLELADVPDNMSDAEKAQKSLTKEWTSFTTGIVSGKGSLGEFFTVLTKGIASAMSSINIAMGTGASFYRDVAGRVKVKGAGVVKGELETERKQLRKEVFESREKYGALLKHTGGVTLEDAAKLAKIESLTKAIDKFTEKGISAKKAGLLSTLGLPTIEGVSEKDKVIDKTGKPGKPKITKAEADSLTKISTQRSVKSLTINMEALVVNKDGGSLISTTNITESMSEIERKIYDVLSNVINSGSQQIFA